MSTAWPDNWDQLFNGSECSMCRHDIRVESDRYGVRIYAGKYADAYLQRADVQRGYTLVIWHGRHVSEPVELTEEEAAGYWLDTLNVARALIKHFKPLKMNYETLGNGTPHLHTHLVPRYWDDPAAGQPFPLSADEPVGDLIEPERLETEIAALRTLLHYDS